MSDFSQIGSISSSNTQFSDYNAPTGDIYYQIEAVKSTPISVKNGLEKVMSVLTSSRSNIATNATDISGVEELNASRNNFMIYPNPSKDNFMINIDSKILVNTLKIKIYNLTGEIVKVDIIRQNNQNVIVSDLPSGIYFLELSSNSSIVGKKLLILK